MGPSSSRRPGIYLKTHDFLQPLERAGKNEAAKGENTVENMKTSTVVEKMPSSSTASVENVLPGGIGTYSISHISNFSQGVAKPERSVYCTERNGEASKSNSDGSFYSNGGAFTLWGESVVKENGTTVKDNAGEKHVIKVPAEKLGPWLSERASPSPFIHRNSFSSQSSSKYTTGQKSQSFMEMMMKSARVPQEEEEDDDEEFVIQKDGPSQKGNSTLKIDGKSPTDQKPVTPRSKHSATEQRRRSKINDRFQILRELIPHSDQKRDKASFLLEVIEHIQLLQEKVHKYEQLCPGWNPGPTKLTPWRNSHGPGESMIDHPQAMKNGPGPGLMFAGKFDDNNVAIAPTMRPNAQTVVESELSTVAAYRPMDHHPGLANKSVSLSIPMQPNTFTSVGQSGGHTQLPLRPVPDAEEMSTQPQTKLWQNKPCTTTVNTPNEQEDMTVEGGTISISSVYSQGLLNSLTQALQSTGVDLSQASISVQIDLGKRAINRLASMTSSAKDHEEPSTNRAIAHSRVASSGEDSDRVQKRLKMETS
ncbi:transcription factor BIM2-like isoform X2 [Macadamia integrifolia]|uniref:transcription factor BIM2-like isoform X2 n=1 Tax=Macadamia integrifolia TaxID=60698 RepID=UPI001C4F80D3|nr:transcription factor BIM2-like isoform X2 [Macadamia integrifolia]